MPLDEILLLRSDSIELLFATDNTSGILFPGFRKVPETLPSVNTNIGIPSAAKRMFLYVFKACLYLNIVNYGRRMGPTCEHGPSFCVSYNTSFKKRVVCFHLWVERKGEVGENDCNMLGPLERVCHWTQNTHSISLFSDHGLSRNGS